MKKRLGVLSAAVLAATAASVLPAAAAPASVPSGASAGAASPTNLVITKTGTSWSGPAVEQVTLLCEPTGGSHPTAEDACTKLAAVGGQFDKLPHATGIACPPVWMPVTVTVTGTWRLQPVDFTRTYSSDCVASTASNYVFRF
ncbi:SSI family serine proteinase inhibitor [Streptomyces abyssomicinicus]|uniref:SSI family serine proteinase inhibitor n=1 Tax=Streptomyces abyssomicinicus TaxID=574929 RepID=UPI00124FC3C8|nr:SSI family serine proteinase inhibitor [Streptomyces abyssomicinicus]